MGNPPINVDGKVEPARFSGLRFDDFRRMATDPSLNMYEKIGFPAGFRQGFEEAILADILAKMPVLERHGIRVLDVGPGCSELPRLIVDHAVANQQELILLDAPEMLSQLPDGPNITKVPGRFPDDCPLLAVPAADGIDAIIVYSVLQHVFLEGNPFVFLDALLMLLRPGGYLLLGDIPNVSKRHRFLSSAAGLAYHNAYIKTGEPPEVGFNRPEPGRITDAVMLGLVERARAAGFDAFILPQPDQLPMANRREDILIRRP